MKKVSLLLLAIFAFASASLAQVEMDIHEVVRAPGAITVPLDMNITAPNAVATIDVFIEYNPALLTFTGITNANSLVPGISAFPVGAGRIFVTWDRGTNPYLIDDLKLFDLQFDYTGGGTSILWFDQGQGVSVVTGKTDVVSTGADVTLDVNYDDGSVSPEGSATLPLSNWAIFVGLGLIVAFLVVRFRKLV